MKYRSLTITFNLGILFLVFSSQLLLADTSFDSRHSYKTYVAPLVGDIDAVLQSGNPSSAVRSGGHANTRKDSQSYIGSIAPYLSGEQETVAIDGRKTGFVLMPPGHSHSEMSNSQPLVQRTNEMIKSDVLPQLLMTLYMTDPSVANAAVGGYRISNAFVQAAQLANINMFQQLDGVEDWKRSNFLTAMNGCLKRHMEAGKGFMQAQLFCSGDAIVTAKSAAALSKASATAKDLLKPSEDHVDLIGGSGSGSGANGDVTMTDVMFNQRINAGGAGAKVDWQKLKDEFVEYYGDFVINPSGSGQIGNETRVAVGGGSTYNSYTFAERNVHPTIDYNQEHFSGVEEHFQKFKELMMQLCIERDGSGSSPHSGSIEWKEAEDNFEFYKDSTIKSAVKDLSTPDFMPDVLFFEALYDQLGYADHARTMAGFQCPAVDVWLDLSRLTPENKYIIPAQIMFRYSEWLTEIKMLNSAIAMKNKILGESNMQNSQEIARELVKRIVRVVMPKFSIVATATAESLGTALGSRKAYAKAQLKSIHDLTVAKNAPEIGLAGSGVVASFSAGTGGNKKGEAN